MKIQLHKNFEKNFKALPKNLREKTIQTIKIFAKNPKDIRLKNHALKGKLKGKRAFSVTGDIRVIFEEIDGYVLVLMLDIGTHNKVYQHG